MRKTVMRYLLILCSMLCAFTTMAQSLGSWRTHLAYHNATQCVVAGDKVYVVSDGSLYSYTPEDEFVENYDKSNILSDHGIRHIGVCEESNTLVIVYENANIDLIRPDGSVVNITDFANMLTYDPKVNDLRIMGSRAYLSTNFGVVILDVEREEFYNAYMLNKTTNSCVELDNTIYAATEQGLYCGSMDENLLDTANWKLRNSEVYAQLAIFDKHLMALKAKESVYSVNLTDGTPTLFRKGPIHFMHSVGSKFIVGNHTNTFVYHTTENNIQLSFAGDVNYLVPDGDCYWTTNGAKGLNGYRYDAKTKSTTQIISQIAPNSPIRNHCQYLSFVDNDRLLVAGGNINYYDWVSLHRNGTLMMYEDGTWHSFEEEGIAKQTAGRYRNMTSIVQDPKDPNHHYASSFGQGIYEFRDMRFVRQYTHKEKTGLSSVVASPLESAAPSSYEYTRISRLQYDRSGNLWITNPHGESPIKIMKPDNTFISLYYPELEHIETVSEILFDCNGWIWVVSLQGPAGLFCIDLNGTLENTNDDRIKVFNEKFTDQDGGVVEVYYINDIAEDHNGDLWVMTDKGPYVLYNTEEAFSDNYHFTKIKVPRNDGTNYADYLLDGSYTTCIEIDAANRKWIGTLNNGLYLIASDGLATTHHFTKDNTPLPSNSIESLALHHPSGELFIGTDRGIVSYMSDATRAEETYDEAKVYTYPNPVTSDYDGPITIVGLKADSHIKIINTAGRLVAEGTSLGGSFTWYNRPSQSQHAATGVYYVLGCDEEGNEGIVTKVLFIK